jgi:hypothetical protein
MREIRMSSLMSGDGRRGATPIGSATAPFLDSTRLAQAQEDPERGGPDTPNLQAVPICCLELIQHAVQS